MWHSKPDLESQLDQLRQQLQAQADQQQQPGPHIDQQQHEQALQSLRDEMQQAVANAKAQGEASVQAQVVLAASGYER